MSMCLKYTDEPSSDTAHVALSRGVKYAEYDDCEARVNWWNSNNISSSSSWMSASSDILHNINNNYDRDTFFKSDKQGR